MIIESPAPPPKRILEYDILMTNGMVLPVTLEPAVGDDLSIGASTIDIFVKGKASPTNPSETLPDETIQVFLAHVMSIQHREKFVPVLTRAESDQWMKTILEMSGGGGSQLIN